MIDEFYKAVKLKLDIVGFSDIISSKNTIQDVKNLDIDTLLRQLIIIAKFFTKQENVTVIADTINKMRLAKLILDNKQIDIKPVGDTRSFEQQKLVEQIPQPQDLSLPINLDGVAKSTDISKATTKGVF